MLSVFPYEVEVDIRIDILSNTHINLIIGSHENAVLLKSIPLDKEETRNRMISLKDYCNNADFSNLKERISVCFCIMQNGILNIPYLFDNNKERNLSFNVSKCNIINHILEN